MSEQPGNHNEKAKAGGCSMDKTKNPNEMEKYNASLQDMSKLVEGLDKFGKAEYKGFPGIQSGPILVVFKEIHNNDEIKLQNFSAFVNNRGYFNFLATEGTDEVVSSKYSILYRKFDFILGLMKEKNDFFSFSSDAIEEFYGGDINTCGVDLDFDTLLKISEIIKLNNKLSREDKENLFDIVITKRNNLWLSNIRSILISGNNKVGKNFVSIVAGGRHSNGLLEEAQNFGFKGVIIFTPNSYEKK